MGANCCIAARNKSPSSRNSTEVSRNVRYSPSWSFRWDNRTHIEDIVDNQAQLPHRNSGNVDSENKSAVDTETEGLSDGASPINSFQHLRWQKSPTFGNNIGSTSGERDHSMGSDSSVEEVDSSKITRSSAPDPVIQAPQTCKSDPSSSCSRSLPLDPTSSRKACRSPGYQLSRQVSDSRIPVLKSLNESNSTEGRHSFALPACASDLSAGGSNGGSSDGWSMRMFSELVASSQRDMWSFDGESFSFGHGRITGFHGQPFLSPPADLRACGVCSKLLKERSPWSSQKIVSNNELSVAAILVCGHVYHAECLENVTSDIDRYDPPCPVCANGGKSASKLLRKAEMKARGKISRIAVADNDPDSDSVVERWKVAERQGKSSRTWVSSSFKSSFSKPFLKRHFSIGPRTSRSLSVNENTRKKGFWSKYRKD